MSHSVCIIVSVVIIVLLVWMIFSTDDQTTENFFVKNPYDSLDTRHYYQQFINKQTPRYGGEIGPGFFKSYPNFFDRVEGKENLLNNFWLGYSVDGYPYNKLNKWNPDAPSKKYIDIRHPDQRFEYKEWLDYSPQKAANYIGWPFYFH